MKALTEKEAEAIRAQKLRNQGDTLDQLAAKGKFSATWYKKNTVPMKGKRRIGGYPAKFKARVVKLLADGKWKEIHKKHPNLPRRTAQKWLADAKGPGEIGTSDNSFFCTKGLASDTGEIKWKAESLPVIGIDRASDRSCNLLIANVLHRWIADLKRSGMDSVQAWDDVQVALPTDFAFMGEHGYNKFIALARELWPYCRDKYKRNIITDMESRQNRLTASRIQDMATSYVNEIDAALEV